MIKVNIVNKSTNDYPTYAKDGDAGMDIKAWITPDDLMEDDVYIIPAGYRTLIPTGIYCKIPEGYQIEVRPRSGLAFKKGITVLNSPGTIDENYIGEIKVILHNASTTDFIVNSGDRIAQLVLMESPKISWNVVDTLENTDRGTSGFGSTGKD